MRSKPADYLILFLAVVFLLQPTAVFAVSKTLDVSAIVPANATDFPVDLQYQGSSFHQDQTIDYHVFYGSTLSNVANITVVASWSLGTLDGTSDPSLEILSFVPSSATPGYNNTPAVVDLTNRTITWTIHSFPAQTTGQEVSFQLKTLNSYSADKQVNFTVSAHIEGPGVTTPESIAYQNYRFVPGPPPPPGPTNSPTPIPTLPPYTAYPIIQSVRLQRVSSTDAAVVIDTDVPTTLTLSYGTSPGSMGTKIIDLTSQQTHTLTMTSLKEDTQYYFVVIAKGPNDKSGKSAIFTFLTGKGTDTAQIDMNSLILTSDNSVLLANAGQPTSDQIVVIPTNTDFSFRFHVLGNELVRSLHARLTTDARQTNQDVQLVETEPGTYTGTLTGKDTPQLMSLIVQIADTNHNLRDQKIATVRIVFPLRVLDKRTQKPVEHAKVTLSLFNQTTHIFQAVSPVTLGVTNPTYTNPQGEDTLILPRGRYKAIIEAIGFQDQTVEFVVGTEDYPTIYLVGDPFAFLTYGRYLATTAGDITNSVQTFVLSLSRSSRYFDLFATIILLCFVLLALIASGARLEVSLAFLPWYLLFRIKQLFLKPHMLELGGRVINHANDGPLDKAFITFTDKRGKILAHTLSNHFGQFIVRVPKTKAYVLSVTKDGFEPLTSLSVTPEQGTSGGISMWLQKKETHAHIFHDTVELMETGIGFLFEVFLLVSVCIEVVFGIAFGFFRVLPFLTISIANIAVWILHLHHLRILKQSK